MLLRRAVGKSSQIVSLFLHSRTPISLALDSLRLKKKSFVAFSNGGLKLRLQPDSGESYTFYENIIRRTYFDDGFSILRGSTIVDVGANIGAFSILAASLTGLTGRVIAIEPVHSTFDRLKRNVELNNLKNVECINAAVDSREGTLTLRLDRKSAYASAYRTFKFAEDQLSETTPSITLDQVIEKFEIDHIDFLKIDCEGSEHGIFQSLSLQTARRIRKLSMEVHRLPGMSDDLMENNLVKLGFIARRGPIWTATQADGV